MTKLWLFALAPVAALVATSSASAQQYAGHCSQCQTSCNQQYGPTYHDSVYDNLIWPRQYMAPARRGICQAFELTVANGWRRNNLLGKYDFAPNGEGLSDAGRLRVEWILANAPPQRRTIFVQRGADAEQTAQRVEAVQMLAANSHSAAGPINVQETYMQDDGRPAATVDAVFTGFSANQPPPVLPASNLDSTTEGS